jgi:hypothetical protein
METSRFRAFRYLVHDMIGEWELDRGYDIHDSDRALLAMRLVDAFRAEYGMVRIKDDHYTLIPADTETDTK